MLRALLGTAVIGILMGFAAPRHQPPAATLENGNATACEHVDETFVFDDVTTHSRAESTDAERRLEPSKVAVAVVCGDCCPTYDPDYDCWADGHWHYNHCKEAPGCGLEKN